MPATIGEAEPKAFDLEMLALKTMNDFALKTNPRAVTPD